MARVRWTNGALKDLQDETRPFIDSAPVTAERLVDRIMAAAEVLATFPFRGWVVPEPGMEAYREILEGPYRIVHRVIGDDVLIVAVAHGRRKLRNRLHPDESGN